MIRRRIPTTEAVQVRSDGLFLFGVLSGNVTASDHEQGLLEIKAVAFDDRFLWLRRSARGPGKWRCVHSSTYIP